jgi:hypothetical protein
MSQHFTPHQEQVAVHASNALEDLLDELPEAETRALNDEIDERFRSQTVTGELE